MTGKTADVKEGSRCVLDANVLLHAHEMRSDQAREILKRCATSEIIGILPSTGWAEVMHRLMIAEALQSGKIAGPNPARKLAGHPEIVRELVTYRSRIADYRSLGLLFEPCLSEDVLAQGPALQKEYGLLTNDSIVLACAMRIGADFLVTADKAFRQVARIQVVLLSDIG